MNFLTIHTQLYVNIVLNTGRYIVHIVNFEK